LQLSSMSIAWRALLSQEYIGTPACALPLPPGSQQPSDFDQ
jgi:hypothetical protein